MRVADWRWPHVALLWAGALVAGIGGATLGLLADLPFHWLLPYPGTPHAAWLFLQGVWYVAPTAVVGLVGPPLAAAAVTVYRVLARRG